MNYMPKFGLALLSIAFIGCVATPKINYNQVSVPEEGGMHFTKYTDDYENIYKPAVNINAVTGLLQWYAAPMITVSPNGEHLGYIALKNDFTNINLRKIKGGKSIVQRTFNKNVQDMSYSPDGSKIAFSALKGGSSNIYVINATEGASVQQLVAGPNVELGPTFSPDGKFIYFTRAEGGRFYIWSVNVETAIQTQYTEGFTPIVSPDGSFLVITRNNKATGRGEIWSIDIEKGTETMLLSNPKTGYSSPSISPDGKRILCVGTSAKEVNANQNLDLYVFNIDGTKLKQLTFHPGHDMSPQWTPDGKSVLFLSQRGNVDGQTNVWKFDVK
jgi:Tol biopolymer transport system component